MNGSIFNGVSALNTYQQAIDTESHNVANVNTVAFKSDTISFADMMYNKGIGNGVQNLNTFKLYDQGGFNQTGNQFDFAISGDGFFTIQSPIDTDDLYYTRAGNFKMSTDGTLTTVDGFNILGVQPTVTGDKITSDFSNYIATGVIVENETTLTTVNVFSTRFQNTAVETGTSGNNYKTKSSNINDIDRLSRTYDTTISLYGTDPVAGEPATYQQNQITFDKTLIESKTYDMSLSIDGKNYTQAFDTDIDKTLRLFSDKISQATGLTSSIDTATGVLTIDSLIPGENFLIKNASVNGQNLKIEQTQGASGSGKQLVDEMFTQLKKLIETSGGQVAINTSEIIKSTTDVQPTLGTIQLNMDTLGISEDIFGDLTIDDGLLYLNQGEAKYVIGEIPPMVFTDNSGLNPQGSNRYKKTSESGEPKFIENKSKVVTGMLELSTADLSDSLVKLMTFQKAFDANSKSITTSDEFLKTALGLKKS